MIYLQNNININIKKYNSAIFKWIFIIIIDIKKKFLNYLIILLYWLIFILIYLFKLKKLNIFFDYYYINKYFIKKY